MTKEIRLNAFDMNCVVHQSAGLWTHPRDRAVDYTSLEYWTDLAQILERGRFDGLFIADVLGVYDVYGGNADTALSQGIQVPLNDPVLVIPPMAQVTKHLGFGVTCTLSFEPPYPFARRMSTLDHLTRGRIGWNIVTGYLNSAAKGVGMNAQNAHDHRYDIADEYMEVVYKLWEGSWEDDAVVRDRKTASSHGPTRFIRFTITARTIASMRFTCASPRHNALRCSTRRAPRIADASSRRGTPSACSCWGRQSRWSRRASRTFAGAPHATAAIRRKY